MLYDTVGSLLIAAGLYNFAAASEFPVTGISGIALVFYHFWRLPIGIMTLVLNIPLVILCIKVLGVRVLFKTFTTLAVLTFFTDIIAPVFPAFRGHIFLSAVLMGVISGIGYALIYIHGSSTGGTDFVSLAIQKLNPHITLGKIFAVIDCSVLLFCGILMGGGISKILYGLLSTFIISMMIDITMTIHKKRMSIKAHTLSKT